MASRPRSGAKRANKDERISRQVMHDVLRSAITLSPMPMIMTDPNQPDNPVVFCNRAFAILTGYEQDEITGRNCRILQGPKTDPDAIERIRAAVAARRDITIDIYNYRKDGTGFWNALFMSPVFSPDGSILFFLGSQLDVTYQHQIDTNSRQSERRQALYQLAADITSIGGQMVGAGDYLPPEEAVTIDAAIVRAAQQAPTRAHRNPEPTNVNALLAALESQLRQFVGENCVVSLNLSSDDLPVHMSPAQFGQAMLNLVQNAKEAMPQGGCITIETRLLSQTASGRSGAVEITVRDTGIGMAGTILARATQPHFTTKPNKHGAGLPQVQAAIQEAGGNLAISSRMGEGTSVSMTLPIRVLH
jgi:PAS domain S-box-containing protein